MRPLRVLARVACAGVLLSAAVTLAACELLSTPPAKTSGTSVPKSPAKERSKMTALGFTTDAFQPTESGASESSADSSAIPAKFAMKGIPGGQNVSIPYAWGLASGDTKSFALSLVDAHPDAHRWVHWMVIDIPANVTVLPEGISGSTRMPAGTRELTNTFGSVGYGGPQPPAGSGPHEYVATLYALDVPSLDLPADATLAQFEHSVSQHAIGSETCTGWFAR